LMSECANSDAQGRRLIDMRVRRRHRGGWRPGTSVPGCFAVWLWDDCFECTPLRLHSDVGVVFQHLLRYIASNLPDGFVPGAALGKVGDERVPVIVPPTTHAGFFPNVAMMSSE
jgi:hypothetical protein